MRPLAVCPFKVQISNSKSQKNQDSVRLSYLKGRISGITENHLPSFNKIQELKELRNQKMKEQAERLKELNFDCGVINSIGQVIYKTRAKVIHKNVNQGFKL